MIKRLFTRLIIWLGFKKPKPSTTIQGDGGPGEEQK